MGDGLTLEKLKIDERLRAVELSLAESVGVRKQILEAIERIEKKLDKIDPMEKSIIDINNRLERVENAEEDRKKTVGTVVKTAIGSIVLAVGSFVVWAVKTLIITLK